MRVLTFTSLFPSVARPTHGIFVETRLRQLLTLGSIESRVIAPVPHVPLFNSRFGYYAGCASTPTEETRDGIKVVYPRYPVVPGIGIVLSPFSMAFAAATALRQLRADGFRFDLIDAHYFYPDGVAAALLARHFNCPFVVTARGTDINLHAREFKTRSLVLWAARRASTVITVSGSLERAAVDAGIDPCKIVVLRNGVDTDRFRPLDRDSVRRRLSLGGTVLLCVGNLVPEKGQDIVLKALTAIEGATLLFAGDGPQREILKRTATELGVSDRVRFLGMLDQAALVEYYNAADLLVLASSREGWPNVLLESMACGTPAIAANVGGCSEVISTPAAGLLLPERSPESIAQSVHKRMRERTSREATRRHAEAYGWGPTSQGQLEVFRRTLAADGDLRASRAVGTC